MVDTFAGFGRLGIQLFYFISAVTMCYTWTLRQGETNPIRKFYIRRTFRIAPLFWIAIPIYLLVNGFQESYWAPEGIGTQQIVLTTVFLHGFWPSSINSVVPGGWSIAIEMTFYLLFPILITTLNGNRIWYLISAISIWIFNIFIFRDWLTDFLSVHYNTSSTTIVKDYLYLNFINQAPIFLLGCYLYFSLDKTIKKTDIIILSLWLLFGIYLRMVYKIDGLGFLISYLTLAVFVYCCIKANLRLGLFELLGKNSYAIYLSHFLVLHYLIKITPIESGLLAFLFGIILTTFISYILSVAIYVLLETKVQRYVNKILLD